MSLVAEFRSPLIQTPYSPGRGGVGAGSEGSLSSPALRGIEGTQDFDTQEKSRWGELGKSAFILLPACF